MSFTPLYAAWVIQKLGNLQKTDENLSDLKIRIGDTQFHCHRFHMSACSEFFRVLLGIEESKENDTKPVDVSEPVVVLTIKGIESDTFENILGSIYRAENNLTEQNMIDLWHAVSDLQINFLVSECEEFIMNKISLSNYLNIYESAVLLKSERVLASIYPFLVKHYRDFITSQTFFAMSLEWFEDFLHKCGSAIQPPDLLVESIIAWVSHVPETIPGQENGTDLPKQSDMLNSNKKKRKQKTEKGEELDDANTRKLTEVVFVKVHGKDGIKAKPIGADTRRSHVGTLLKETNLALVSRECLKTLLETDIVMDRKDAREFVNKTVAQRMESQVPENPNVTEKPLARFYLCIVM
ncbi:unnamed protein product [Lymnaea stagnalis]|uniref:BTB domain-containing protein n=1 Tax=Lymnaea stagnalis TaxID=6523 RepID=A0AAV2HGY4_LYMST